MVKRAIGSHYGQVPMLGTMALENKIEAYNLPMGSISRMIRAAANRSPGHITDIGFGTMADPKLGGGKVNNITKENLVDEIEVKHKIYYSFGGRPVPYNFFKQVSGKKFLIYKAIPINVAIIRGTTADATGNITMERESIYADNLIQAMAARASGGIVLAQVERIATDNSLRPRQVKIPGTLVDGLIIARPENHWMSYVTPYDPGCASEIKTAVELRPMAMDARKIVARRALLEVVPNQVVNLGVGLPEGVARVAEEEKLLDFITLTTAAGVHGGVEGAGADLGTARNYDAVLDLNQQFDFYNGGGLDVCFLGMGEVTAAGDVNVSRVGGALKGPGSFIDVSQSTRRVNLVGTFTAGGLEVAVADGRLTILREGRHRKFVPAVREVAFSGANAVARNQLVHYVTERCVFALSPDGLELVEVAPGVDVQTQILDQMGFRPIVRRPPRLMDPRIFRAGRMRLLESLCALDMPRRLHYSEESRTLYIDLHGVSVTTREHVREVEGAVQRFFAARPGLAKRVDVFVNYDGFDCRDELAADFAAQARRNEERFYATVRRLSSAGFARHKLAGAMGLSLRGTYSFDEVVELLASMGHAVSRDTVLNLCARFDTSRDGLISSDELGNIVAAIR